MEIMIDRFDHQSRETYLDECIEKVGRTTMRQVHEKLQAQVLRNERRP